MRKRPSRLELFRLAKTSVVKLEALKFTLKHPCSDCPFREATPHHNGIAANLPGLVSELQVDGTIAQTCHKTDPMSDGFKEGYKGKPQHCAGMLYVLRGKTNVLRDAVKAGRAEDRYSAGYPGLFKNINAMVDSYVGYLKRLKAERKKNAVRK